MQQEESCSHLSLQATQCVDRHLVANAQPVGDPRCRRFGNPQQPCGIPAEIHEQGTGVSVCSPPARRQGRNDRGPRTSLDRPARNVHRPLPLPGRACRRGRQLVCGGSRRKWRRMRRRKCSGPGGAGSENQEVRPRGPSWPPRPRVPQPTRRGRTSSLRRSIRVRYPVASSRSRNSRRGMEIAEVDGNPAPHPRPPHDGARCRTASRPAARTDRATAEVDGNRTRRTGIARPTRFEGGGAHQALGHLQGRPYRAAAASPRVAGLRRPAGRGRRCPRRGGAASTSPAPRSGECARGSG